MGNMLHTDLIQKYYDDLTAAQRRVLRERVHKLQPTNRAEEDKLIEELSLEYNIRTYLLSAGMFELTDKLLSDISLRRDIVLALNRIGDLP